MITKKEAFDILRLNTENPSQEEIDSAFSRMRRRYPAHLFPEKSSLIFKAKERLSKGEKTKMQHLLDGKIGDLSWLLQHFPPEQKKLTKEVLTVKNRTDIASLYQLANMHLFVDDRLEDVLEGWDI